MEREMSAFFVGADHVDAILTWVETFHKYSVRMPDGLDDGHPTPERLTLIGKALLAENIASLRARYPDDWQEMVDIDVNTYRYRRDFWFPQRGDTHVAVMALCNSLNYQSCEHDAWQESYAKRFLDFVIHAAIRQLPGYDEAPWHYDREAHSKAA